MRLRRKIQHLPDGVGSGATRLNRPVFLIGFMGVGKSSVAAVLGQTLGVPVREMDEVIAERENRSIPEIFQQDGEAYFREVEHRVLEEQRRLITDELTTTSQRVNLVEKVKIPSCKENIRVIDVYLGDQQTAAVVRGKIAKKKLAEA